MNSGVERSSQKGRPNIIQRENIHCVRWAVQIVSTCNSCQTHNSYLITSLIRIRPPLWSSGQSFWLQIQRSRVRSPALPNFLSSSGSGTGSTQPREPREVN